MKPTTPAVKIVGKNTPPNSTSPIMRRLPGSNVISTPYGALRSRQAPEGFRRYAAPLQAGWKAPPRYRMPAPWQNSRPGEQAPNRIWLSARSASALLLAGVRQIRPRLPGVPEYSSQRAYRRVNLESRHWPRGQGEWRQ